MRSRFARRLDRGLVRLIKRKLNIPDAYITMGKVFRQIDNAVILDIGSHYGDTVLKFLDYSPHAEIHSFEPTPASAGILRQRMVRHTNVKVHETALCERNGVLRFTCNVNGQTNSLLKNVGDKKYVVTEGQRQCGEIEVKGMRLDDWIREQQIVSPLIVKADVQGAELLLIEGGQNAFGSKVKLFYSEVSILPQYEGQASFWELHKVLTERHGFALVDIFPCGKDVAGRAAYTDAMWVREEILGSLDLG